MFFSMSRLRFILAIKIRTLIDLKNATQHTGSVYDIAACTDLTEK